MQSMRGLDRTKAVVEAVCNVANAPTLPFRLDWTKIAEISFPEISPVYPVFWLPRLQRPERIHVTFPIAA